MTKKISVLAIIFAFISVFLLFNNNTYSVNADSLTDSVNEQLENIDLSHIEDYFNNLQIKPQINYIDYLSNLLKGEYSLDFNLMLNGFLQIFFNQVFASLPIFLSIIAITIFCSITQSFKNTFLSQSVSDLIFFICFISVILMLFSEIVFIYENTKKTIENISKLIEIMSPIMLTLIIASGGTVSASIYRPTIVFLSSGVVNIFLNLILPLVSIMMAFSVVSNFSSSIKLNKFIDCASSIIKWVIGLTVTIFGLFITINGISSANHDGISIRATKYAITNSIPIVGGFIKDSFDFILAGSVLIKNAIGITSVLILFFTILSPIISIAVFSLLIKFTSAITENIGDVRISNFCTSMSKCISYLCACIVMVSFMFFIMVVLMILTGNTIF